MGTGPHHHNTNAQGLWMQPQETRALVSLSGFVAASPNPCSSLGHWAGLKSMQDRKPPLEKLRERGPSLAQARLAMECCSWPARQEF